MKTPRAVNRFVFATMLSNVLGMLFITEVPARDLAGTRAAPSATQSSGSAPPSNGQRVADADIPSDTDTRRYLSGGTDTADELLPPDQAFTASISVTDANTLVAVFTPANGYFLYRDKFVFRVQQPSGVEVAGVALPRGEIKDDPFFGRTEVFHRPVQVQVRLKRTNSSARVLMLYVRYQGCNEPLGVCYIPIEKNLRIALPLAVPGSKNPR